MTEQQIRNEAEKYATEMDKYAATEHCLAKEGFEAGVQWILSQQKKLINLFSYQGLDTSQSEFNSKVMQGIKQQTKPEKTAWQIIDQKLSGRYSSYESQLIVNAMEEYASQFQYPDSSSSLRDALEKLLEDWRGEKYFFLKMNGKTSEEANEEIDIDPLWIQAKAALNNTMDKKQENE